MGSNTVAKCWLHIIISTHEEEKLFSHKEVALKLRNFLFHFGEMNDIKIKSCSAIGEHLHMLVDLQLHYSIDELVNKIRNAAAAWLNEQNFFEKDFHWEKVIVHFLCHLQIFRKLLNTLTTRKIITELNHSKKNTSTLLKLMEFINNS